MTKKQTMAVKTLHRKQTKDWATRTPLKPCMNSFAVYAPL